MNRLDVYLHGDLVGYLDREEHARLSFAYHLEWINNGGDPRQEQHGAGAKPAPYCRPGNLPSDSRPPATFCVLSL